MKINIRVWQEVEIDESLLELYADGVRERLELERTDTINMIDIVIQAMLDGDIDRIYEFELDSEWDDSLTREQISELAQPAAPSAGGKE